jgi:P4 family phage/plasmid primase-like protien
MKLVDYLKKHGIQWFPINIRIDTHTDGTLKKVLLPYLENQEMPKQTDFELLTSDELNKRFLFKKYRHIAIDTRFIQQIDIDSGEARDKFLPIMDEYPYFKSASKLLPHIFIILADKGNFGKRFTWTEIDDKVEILNGQWSWANADTEVINSDYKIPTLSILNESLTKKYDNFSFDYSNSNSIIVLLEIIDKRYIDDYNIWWRIGTALFNGNYSFEVFDNWSKRGSKYSGTKKIWDSISKSNNGSIQLGTICYYAKLSNPLLFNLIKDKLPNNNQVEIINKFIDCENIPSLSHSIVSSIFYEKYYYRYAFSKNFWYRLSVGGIYEKLQFDADTIIAKDILEYTQSFIMRVLSDVKTNDHKKKLWKSYTQLETQSFLKSCVEFSKQKFINETLDDELDKNGKLVGFNNGVYDLAKSEFRKGTINDKISITTGYNYQTTIDDSTTEFFDTLIDSLFEHADTSYWFKKHIASCLETDNREEKIYFWVGSGRNGKGSIDTLLRETLGNYYTDLDNGFFTITKKQNSNAEPELVRLKNKRITMTTEPAGEIKYLTDKFKKLSGNDLITCRTLYSTKIESFVPTFKSVIQTNHLPQFTDIDDGLLNRIAVIKFPYKFLDPNNYTVDKFHKQGNDNLKTILKSKKEYFFNYLLKYYRAYTLEGLTKLPDSIAQSIQEYKDNIDNVKTFLLSSIIKTDSDKDRIPVNELLQYYNNWSTENLLLNKFGTRINNHIKTERKRFENKQLMCICNYVWNMEFKNIYSNNQCDF